jgi:ribosomal protein L16 Arg81 hydroxylase
MSACERMSKDEDKTAMELFRTYLTLMDKYSDYFFSEPWPKKYDFKRATTFTSEDLDFIDENEDEYVDRVLTVFLKKNMSLEGFNATFGMFWTQQAYHKQFISPELKPVSEAFKELSKIGTDAKEILTKLKEQFEYVSLVHASLVDLLEAECLAKAIDLKAKEVLDLIHTEEGLPECGEYRCKRQRGKL